MKMVNESIFASSLRAFFVTFFGAIGAFIGFGLLLLVLIGIFSSGEESKHFGHGVKIMSDAYGNRKELPSSTPIVLQIEINSEIGRNDLTAEKIQEILLDSREGAFKNDRVKAIFLTINSPGGSANETNMIYRALKQYKQKYGTPIYAYVDGLCASGGYYLACATDKIYSSDVSLIGSVGVVAWPPFFNVTDAMEKLGVSATTLSAGNGKDAMNPTRTWGEGEEASRQKIIDFYYEDFVFAVTSNRPNVEAEQLVKIHGANVFPASEAKQFGMIDETGYCRDDALKELVRKAGISGEYQVVCMKCHSWWKDLFQEKIINSPLVTGKIQHELVMPKADPYSYLYTP